MTPSSQPSELSPTPPDLNLGRPDLPPDLNLGRFRLLQRAGSGGSADVWKALDTASGLTVALKVGRSAADAPNLGREAMHAALALSPRLPELLDVGRLPAPDGRPFLSLRWIEGAVLAPARVTGDRVALALRVAASAAEALADLHGVGLAHGDVKPDNLLFDFRAGGVHLLDLGLAGPAHASALTGATLRYLARGDADLGDARARDLLALGVLVAEIADTSVAAAADPITAARTAALPRPLATICAALLAPSPGARPGATWVAEMAGGGPGDHADRAARAVRAAYLRVRRAEIEAATGARDDSAPWLAEAIAWAKRSRALSGAAAPMEANLGPLSPAQLGRWLTALAGSAAASWPLAALAAVPERALAETLTALARRVPPGAWTFRDVEAAALGRDAAARPAPARPPGPLDAGEAARLALSLARVPADPAAIAAVERRDDAPAPLVLAAADALRLAGELGRARSLVLREDLRAEPGAAALAADIFRRAGDVDRAEATVADAVNAGADPDGRARAVLARVALDRGDLEIAAAVLETTATLACAPLAEARALLAFARGDRAAALAEATLGEALAATAEERARMAGLRGYVLHGADAEAARAAFASAADHAVRAGAVVEEATYRTGEAAAAVDAGDLGSAVSTARRAALLWEHLGRPALAARALLAAAAALATAGAVHEAVGAAHEALARAAEAGDRRAQAYAHWALADVAPAGSADGLAAAERAAAILDAMGDAAGGVDTLRAAARILRHGALPAARVVEMDRLAAASPLPTAAARLDWYGARAGRAGPGEDFILGALVGLADAPAPPGARGPALAAGVDLAARTGQGEIAQRLLAALGEAARELVHRAPPALAASVRALPWVTRAAAAPESVLRPEQARDLESLIRALGDRERLAPLLSRIVDALVLWTGVERGLLLLRAPDGRLVPRAARNLARADLGPEQMGVSQSLARRALEAREPVVAVDADGEMGNLHQSIHALKLRSVLAIPLIARGEPLGVVYLDDRIRKGAFGARELDWARTIASLAALVIADARDHVLLRRAARQARRASEKLAETLSLREAALDVAERALAQARGQRETRFAYDGIVGASAPMRTMLRLVDRVTSSEVPVLVVGESGSGKELVARAIHDNGPRRARAFVSENCGAIPEGLLESALFGHVRGAFTGAAVSRAGLFEVADRGTLFLDEIGEMSLGMQTKLLRVLEDGLVRPVGSERARKVDVRVVAATNRDLGAMVKARTFREDLFYRLDIITVRIPPLRERPEDVPLLVQRFVETYAAGKKVHITPAALARLTAFAWPGNVRQLQNEVRRALVLSDDIIDVAQLSPEIAGDPGAALPETGLHVRRRIDQLERGLVTDAMERTGGNQTQAAKLLGLSRFGLQKMIKRLEIG
jgi:transcriptional regulator with GAF, ATPase, and Fis domain